MNLYEPREQIDHCKVQGNLPLWGPRSLKWTFSLDYTHVHAARLSDFYASKSSSTPMYVSHPLQSGSWGIIFGFLFHRDGYNDGMLITRLVFLLPSTGPLRVWHTWFLPGYVNFYTLVTLNSFNRTDINHKTCKKLSWHLSTQKHITLNYLTPFIPWILLLKCNSVSQ